jgi:hypothetical protein
MIPDVSGQPLWMQAIAGIAFVGIVVLVMATLPPFHGYIERWRDKHFPPKDDGGR